MPAATVLMFRSRERLSSPFVWSIEAGGLMSFPTPRVLGSMRIEAAFWSVTRVESVRRVGLSTGPLAGIGEDLLRVGF